MTSESTTRWPLLEERRPLAHASHGTARRKLPRSAWLLAGLAFICGGLISAAAFSIGWRHQAQRDTAAREALATATTHEHALEQQVSTLRTSLAAAESAAAHARAAATATAASERAVGARISGDAATASSSATAMSSDAGSLTGSAGRIAGELKTLDTYLTTTPAGQIDPGYVASQATYLGQQLTKLQSDAGRLGDSAASFEAAARKLTRIAATLSAHR